MEVISYSKSDSGTICHSPLPSPARSQGSTTESCDIFCWSWHWSAPPAPRRRRARRMRSPISRAAGAAAGAGMAFKVLDEHAETVSGHVSIGTMHLAKGLEFRAVAVMACDDEIIPLQERIETVGDDADLQEVYDTEHHLLYVACTRARDHLLVTGAEPVSEFLDDFTKGNQGPAGHG